MDELLRDFLAETNESLDKVDVELVRFEQEPNNARILANIFRLVHTIKGTCGFLGLSRLEALAHAAETLMGRFRDGMPVTSEAVSLILATIDRIKEVLGELERTHVEAEGSDADLIGALDRMAAVEPVAAASALQPAAAKSAVGSLVYQVLQRPLRPGEDSLDDLERAFRATPGPEPAPPPAAPAPPADRPPHADLRSAADKAEGDAADSKTSSGSIRVHVDILENLMTMVSELVLTRNQLLDLVRRHDSSDFTVALQRLSNVTAELQEGVMKARMQPIGNAWQKLPRVVRDLALELSKEIELDLRGADTELDRQVLDLIRDPLTHMVRNAADHGIEPVDARRRAGKPEKGTIRLSAYHDGGYIIIDVSDDGRGLDSERIKARALALGLATAAEVERMAEPQVHKLIFAPGFSTAASVTSVSGRGVGMDVVRNNVEQIGGTIEVKSLFGSGTTFSIKIPLTLAIVSALIVEACGQRFAIPQLSVVELVRAHGTSEHRIERIKDTRVLRLRNRLLPVTHLGKVLDLAGDDRADAEGGFIVVTRVGSQTFGIVVDGVLHTEEIVIKPLSTRLRHIPMFSGTTILGDGSVILIIDPNGVAQAIGTAPTPGEEEVEASPQAAAMEATSLLLFRAGSTALKAVPLSLVTRIEEIDCRRIELANGRHLVQYRGQLMPLVRADSEVRVRTEGSQPLLVFSDGGRAMALVVDEIVDIVEDRLDIDVGSDSPGVLGCAVINGQATEIVDIGHFLPLAYADWFRRREVPGAAPRRVLLVDDSAFFRDMLTPVVKAAGYEVASVAGGEEALACLSKGLHVDAIISDIEMPGLNGFDLAEAVRADPRTARVPVIALWSTTSPESIERGRRAGFRAFVAKFDRPGLIAALQEATLDWGQAA